MLRFLKSIDFLIIIPAILLSSLGLLLIFSTSFEEDPSLFVRQAGYIAFSVIIFIAISRINFKTTLHFSPLLYLLLLALLVFTLVFGSQVRGSVRWIDLGEVTVQVSEIAKPILLLTLVYILTRFGVTAKSFLVSFILILLPALLIAKQPDLSSSVILFSTWIFMVFISGVQIFYLAALGIIFLIFTPFVWNLLLKDYQKNRIASFFNPNLDPQGTSYNVVQALIALGSGQLAGRGLGRGTQAHLNFLPENRTDFIFSVAGEELGFIGISMIVLIFALLIYWVLRVAKESKSVEATLFCYGVAFILTLQFFINAGMNMGIFPVSGVTLPFVSFGGSSIVSMFVLLGLTQAAKRKPN